MSSTAAPAASSRAQRVAVKQERDYRQCVANPCTFMVRHVEIEDPDGTVIPLQLWGFQREAVMELHEHGAVIVLKARRLGLSWIFLAYALWLAITQQGIRILILCKNGDDAKQLLDRIRRMRDRIAENPASAHMLAKLKPPSGPKKDRDNVTVLDVGASTIMALMGTPAAARSETAGLVLLDEFGFQRGADEIWQAIYPTIEGGGRIGVISTGNGGPKSNKLGAEFAKQWSRANKGKSIFKALFYSWRRRPGRTEKWKRDTIAALGSEDRFKVEYPEDAKDAFTQVDADLLYPGPHMDAVERLGAEYSGGVGDLWLGCDWGVNTHFLLATRTAGGGLHVLAEWESHNADIETDVAGLCKLLDELGRDPDYIRWDPGGAGAKVIGTFVNLMKVRRPGFRPRGKKIPFSQYKVIAIKYTQLLARRAAADEPLRILTIDQDRCPVVCQQMRDQEWEDTDASKTEKGDDHGADALLTLTAEMGYEHNQRASADLG